MNPWRRHKSTWVSLRRYSGGWYRNWRCRTDSGEDVAYGYELEVSSLLTRDSSPNALRVIRLGQLNLVTRKIMV